MNKTIGFIGAGNMGSAMIGGLVASAFVKASHIHIYDPDWSKVSSLKDTYGVQDSSGLENLVNQSDVLVIAVKPHIYPPVLQQIRSLIRQDHLVVSIAAGVTLHQLEEMVGADKKIFRTMPNTPALVGTGMSAISPNENATPEDLAFITDFFQSFGRCQVVAESLMDVVIGVSGSSPAYAFLFLESMADGAVKNGMARDQAYFFAAQALLGAATMVLETKKHPGELKDMVCSPGGTTIDAVASLEKNGFRNAVIAAVDTAVQKAKAMRQE